MWIPSNAEQLENLISGGAVEEGPTLDFKREVPSSSKELAKDVAAMANDGGTLVFGVGEDSSGQPTVLCPFTLTGVAERVDSIIRTTISEPPEADIQTFPLDRDPSLGYLVVVVPASPRAPHMVTVKGDNRFYGRTAKGNTPLIQGEVARLYQRRQQWEQDREGYLEKVVSTLVVTPNKDFGYAYLYSRPVSPLPRRLSELGDRDAQRNTLYQLVQEAATTEVYPSNFSPSFGGGRFKAISAGWRDRMGGEDQTDPRYILDLHVHFDGELRMFLGRAAERLEGNLLLFQGGLAEITTRFLALTGKLLDKVHYFGSVDLGIAVTGIKGALAWRASQAGYSTQFDQDSYRETLRELSSRLEKDTRGVAASLLGRLFHATGAVGSFDPFSQSG